LDLLATPSRYPEGAREKDDLHQDRPQPDDDSPVITGWGMQPTPSLLAESGDHAFGYSTFR
jgi:hypothetical protein